MVIMMEENVPANASKSSVCSGNFSLHSDHTHPKSSRRSSSHCPHVEP